MLCQITIVNGFSGYTLPAQGGQWTQITYCLKEPALKSALRVILNTKVSETSLFTLLIVLRYHRFATKTVSTFK